MDELDKERESMQKGAAGEKAVARILSRLPDEYRVVNDVRTSAGNLDHVVIGPTGVFVVETKNWRGIIAADGKGELTWNGKPLKTAYVNKFIGRMMGTKDRVEVLAPGMNLFFQAVMVFTSAWVEAKFGTTGRAHCIRDSQLPKYIIDNKPLRRLSEEDVEVIGQAFAGLAQMDPDFGQRTQVEPQRETVGAAR